MDIAEIRGNVYKAINKMNEVLPDKVPVNRIAEISLSKRMYKCAGMCYWKMRPDGKYNYILRFSYDYFMSDEISEKEKISTIYHELIHTLKNGKKHGREFKEYMNKLNSEYDLGISIYWTNKEHSYNIRKKHGSKKSSKRYEYKCIKCGHIYYKKRKLSRERIEKGLVVSHRCHKCGSNLEKKEY